MTLKSMVLIAALLRHIPFAECAENERAENRHNGDRHHIRDVHREDIFAFHGDRKARSI